MWAVSFLDFRLCVLCALGLFSLLAFRNQRDDGRIHYDWRKTALFDQFLSVNLDVEPGDATRNCGQRAGTGVRGSSIRPAKSLRPKCQRQPSADVK